MVNVSSTKTKLKYSLGAKGSPFYLRQIMKNTVYCTGTLLTIDVKFMDPDPNSDLHPDRIWISIRIRIEIFAWIRIWICKNTNVDPQHCCPDMGVEEMKAINFPLVHVYEESCGFP
jgi:hypothetical protein